MSPNGFSVHAYVEPSGTLSTFGSRVVTGPGGSAASRSSVIVPSRTVIVTSSTVTVLPVTAVTAPRPVSVLVTSAGPGDAGSVLRVYLKYSKDGEPVIHGIERISRPGRRVYRNKQEIPSVLGGLGLAIVSTSKGVLSGQEAVKSGVGGEVLCQVW